MHMIRLHKSCGRRNQYQIAFYCFANAEPPTIVRRSLFIGYFTSGSVGLHRAATAAMVMESDRPVVAVHRGLTKRCVDGSVNCPATTGSTVRTTWTELKKYGLWLISKTFIRPASQRCLCDSMGGLHPRRPTMPMTFVGVHSCHGGRGIAAGLFPQRARFAGISKTTLVA